jgi:hypothetical protein
MKAALALTLSMLVSPALAGGAFAPPARYEGTPKVKTHIVAVPVSQIGKLCHKPGRLLFGCARFYNNPRRCVVIIPDKAFPNWAWPEGGTLVVRPGDVLKHEMAHCNGWPSHHPR